MCPKLYYSQIVHAHQSLQLRMCVLVDICFLALSWSWAKTRRHCVSTAVPVGANSKGKFPIKNSKIWPSNAWFHFKTIYPKCVCVCVYVHAGTCFSFKEVQAPWSRLTHFLVRLNRTGLSGPLCRGAAWNNHSRSSETYTLLSMGKLRMNETLVRSLRRRNHIDHK